MAGEAWRGLDRRSGSVDTPDRSSPDTSNTAPYNGRQDLLGPRPGKTVVTPQGYAGGISGIIPFTLPGATQILLPQFDGTIEVTTISGDGGASIWPTGLVGDNGSGPTGTITHPATTTTLTSTLDTPYSMTGPRAFSITFDLTRSGAWSIGSLSEVWSVLIEPGLTIGGATTYYPGTTVSFNKTDDWAFTGGSGFLGFNQGWSYFVNGSSETVTAATLRVTVTWPASANASCAVTMGLTQTI